MLMLMIIKIMNINLIMIIFKISYIAVERVKVVKKQKILLATFNNVIIIVNIIIIIIWLQATILQHQ